MTNLNDIVAYCEERLNSRLIRDFPGAENGLQLENNGTVSHIGAAVDAGIIPFEKAILQGVDFLIVHHGMFWTPPIPITGKHHRRLNTALRGNLAVYSAHLPLDAHPELGNNAQLANALNLQIEDWFLPYEGTPIALIAKFSNSRTELKKRLNQTFPNGFTAIEHGSETPARIAILTGSGRSALSHLRSVGADTLITGELRQEHFNFAQEEGFNLYICGHYATETFGVRALAAELSQHFNLPHTFIPTDCPL